LGVEKGGHEPPPLCVLSFYCGDVLLARENREIEPDFDFPLKGGDLVSTKEDSRAELTLSDASIVRIDENSEFEIEMVEEVGDPILTFRGKLRLGRIWACVKKLTQGSQFRVSSPVAVAGVRGTVYSFSAEEDSSARIKVYKGEVEVRGKKEKNN